MEKFGHVKSLICVWVQYDTFKVRIYVSADFGICRLSLSTLTDLQTHAQYERELGEELFLHSVLVIFRAISEREAFDLIINLTPVL